MQMQSERLQEYIGRMSRDLVRDYSIPAEMYENQDIKRGLRNNDGTGVLVGISKVGSVQGYYMVDGQRVPMPGKLYYRGISVEDIVDAHQQAGTLAMKRWRICCCSAGCRRRRSWRSSTRFSRTRGRCRRPSPRT